MDTSAAQSRVQEIVDRVTADGAELGLQVAVIHRGELVPLVSPDRLTEMAKVAYEGPDEVMGVPLTSTTVRSTIMNDPVTTLDARFSDTNAEPTSWEATQEVLENAQITWLTTVRADGRPHVTPLVAVWLDGALHFTTGPEEQKAVNLVRNPHVVLTTGNSTWDRGLDVMVEGEARRVIDRRMLERLAAAWRTKWDGRWQYEWSDEVFRNDIGGPALVFAVEPEKVLAFGKGTFSHTRHVPR